MDSKASFDPLEPGLLDCCVDLKLKFFSKFVFLGILLEFLRVKVEEIAVGFKNLVRSRI